MEGGLIEVCELVLCRSTPMAYVKRQATMVRAAKVYQQRLSELGYGTPLWRPEPHPFEVVIGDVGRIDPENGYWDRFFNVLSPAGNELNGRGVPRHFKPLLDEVSSVIQLQRQLQPIVYSTKSIRKINISVSGGIPAA